jgi:hypothetical protein
MSYEPGVQAGMDSRTGLLERTSNDIETRIVRAAARAESTVTSYRTFDIGALRNESLCAPAKQGKNSARDAEISSRNFAP